MSLFNGTDGKITTVNTYLHFLNEATDGKFGTLLPFALFILTFATLKKFGNSTAALSAGITTVLITWLFTTMGITGQREMFIAVVLLAIGAAWWHRSH
jgi:hypothetical protein